MAQVLKTSKKNRILQSAKDNFVAKGIKDTSLRCIARDAGMTVGNLYRYFNSKNDIVDAVIGPVVEELGDFAKIRNDTGYFLATVNDMVNNDQYLKEVMTITADNIVMTHKNYRQEMLILVSDEDTNKQYIDWLWKLMYHIMKESNLTGLKTEFQYEMVSSMVSKAVFHGLHEGIKIMCTTDASIEEYRTVLRGYMISSFGKIVRL